MIFGHGSVFPDGRHTSAKAELDAAEKEYRSAEDRLIKARRNYEDAYQEWKQFYWPKQANPDTTEAKEG